MIHSKSTLKKKTLNLFEQNMKNIKLRRKFNRILKKFKLKIDSIELFYFSIFHTKIFDFQKPDQIPCQKTQRIQLFNATELKNRIGNQTLIKKCVRTPKFKH